MISFNGWLTMLVPLTSLLAGFFIFFFSESHRRARTFFNISSAVAKMALVMVIMWGVYHGRQDFVFSIPLMPGLDFILQADALALLFVTLSAVLWLLTTIYAVGYLEHGRNRSRFFGFFSLCVSATTGIALAGNLVTFLILYELLTLTTYPLVAHRGTEEGQRAARHYLIYTLGAGAILLAATVMLHALTGGATNFAQQGTLAPYVEQHRGSLTLIFGMLVVGFGVKAAIFPLHGWLPRAMVAPAPVSALLHAVAVVKAGAFGIVRVVYDLYGVSVCDVLGVLPPLAYAAAFTIVFGSVRALFQDDLKKRLAYSTISQVSYIVLGVATLGPVATIGGIVHLVHQGVMKITLFLCAGNFAETRHIHKVSEMDGLGRAMPLTMAAFTVGALGMIGIPPIAGFISKWMLGLGAVEAGRLWVIPVLVASSMLNAAYFLPILYRAWFKPLPAGVPQVSERIMDRYLLVPPLVTAALSVFMGLFAGSVMSPLNWARIIALREYGF